MRKIVEKATFVVLVFCTVSCFAQNEVAKKGKSFLDKSWKEIATKMPDEWYGSNESISVADSVLKYQTQIGGWAKNNNYHRGFNQEEWIQITATGIGATIDNGATTTEMLFLAKMHSKVKDERYAQSFNKAFNYILEAQYANGGWPQFYPFRKGRSIAYNSHITYNDDAMLHVMQFLKAIKDEAPVYASMNISIAMKSKAIKALEKGIDCVLKTQIQVNNLPTVWCAQHDEVTLLPANARAYELASYSGSESVGLALFLMEINNPSKEIINAVKGAVTWFTNHKIEGIKLEQVTINGEKDRVVVEDKNAPPMWARFYDLDTELPFFCDRDGIKRKVFGELGYNRRNGYSWYTQAPEKLLANYPSWVKKWNLN
jgi:PelA/Pel-15E family pectate lyase